MSHKFPLYKWWLLLIPTDEEEDVLSSIVRDRSHIEETLRLAAEENSGDYAGIH